MEEIFGAVLTEEKEGRNGIIILKKKTNETLNEKEGHELER